MSARNVLLVESHPGAGAADALALIDTGNHVARCFPAKSANDTARTAFVCRGITEGVCPIQSGVDVALVVRGNGSARPTVLEAGALCALRQGIPLVERGFEELDPYEPWLDARVDDDVVEACERAIERSFDGLRQEIKMRTEGVLADAGIGSTELHFGFAVEGRELHVTVTGPPIAEEYRQRLAIRVAEAVRAGKRSFTKKNFAYEVASNPF